MWELFKLTSISSAFFSFLPPSLPPILPPSLQEAAWTISNITAGQPNQIQAVIDMCLIPPLVQIMVKVLPLFLCVCPHPTLICCVWCRGSTRPRRRQFGPSLTSQLEAHRNRCVRTCTSVNGVHHICMTVYSHAV